ncbi:imidazolonepropionase-like amidohydrolase [Povalibacter uvarum]|uniref:Imidazolonepropionase-like amidohydrolase n=1 Tax=Povalibacter uvarum TaxID=732238 RepID=A0A841HQU3_9GAMM|nr:amidohydrolase family protein [Povalibacter uvarum]MBB6095587.1 imidazolonepropionase-like amidohydrolase [Povalibacter uvarum]
MNRVLALIFACGLVTSPAWSQADAPPEPPPVTVIHAGVVLADPGDAPLSQRTIVVSAGRITAVEEGYQALSKYGSNATLIDLRDRFVLPGLMDMHKHIAMPLDADARTLSSEARLALMSSSVARKILHAGVTTVRDVGDNTGITFAVRDSINAGVIEGPRVFAAGRIISRTGGHGTVRQSPGELAFVPGGCDGPESCRRVTRENIEAGSDWIKVTVSGSGGEATGQATAEPIMLPEEVNAVTEAARRAQRPVAAHAHSTAAINLALESDARTIEHGAYFDDASARLFRKHGAYLVPTAYVAEFVSKQLEKFSSMPGRMDAEGLKRWTQAAIANPGRAWRAGVAMGIGSDSGSLNDSHATVREMELFVAAGIPAAEAIKAATVNNADILGMSARLGRLRAGYDADLIAVQGSPIEDIGRLRDVSFVMKAGKVVKSAVGGN